MNGTGTRFVMTRSADIIASSIRNCFKVNTCAPYRIINFNGLVNLCRLLLRLRVPYTLSSRSTARPSVSQ